MTYLLLFIVLLFLSGLFSSAEIAFFSLSDAKVKTLVEKSKKNSKLIWKLKQKPQDLLITILIGNNIVNVYTASLATVITTKAFGSAGIGIATGVVTIFILIFGEITPKSIAQKHNVTIASLTAPFFIFLEQIFKPVIFLLTKFNDIILAKIKGENIAISSEEEIRAMARMGVETGSIDYIEREMIENIFKFDTTSVKQVMTPKYKIISLNGNVPIEQISYFLSQKGHSRYPVYIGNQRNFIGYVHIHDIMKYLNSEKRGYLVKKIVRPIQIVKDTYKIDRVFKTMLKTREHIALVSSAKNGKIVGLITLEDIIEKILGNISDETDKN